jgi:hypothetical protein
VSLRIIAALPTSLSHFLASSPRVLPLDIYLMDLSSYDVSAGVVVCPRIPPARQCYHPTAGLHPPHQYTPTRGPAHVAAPQPRLGHTGGQKGEGGGGVEGQEAAQGSADVERTRAAQVG